MDRMAFTAAIPLLAINNLLMAFFPLRFNYTSIQILFRFDKLLHRRVVCIDKGVI